MNADRLLAHYERIADAPDAITHLRRFILDLAVRGKLVEQDPNDEPASELLKRIAAEKARLVKAGEIKKAVVNPIDLNDAPFHLPLDWIWSTVGELMHVEMGQSPPSEHYNQSGEGLPFYQGKTDFGPRHPSPRYWCTQPKKLALPGDILISVRAPVGPTNLTEIKCCIGRGLAALKPYAGAETDFALMSLRAFEPSIAAMGFGSTFVAINKRQLALFPFPLPPLAEQRRIVAKVDELIALCDRLEVARAEREATRDRLTAASLVRLDAPDPDPDTFRNHAAFALENFAPLTTRLDQIKALRQTILNLAVRGKLVDQDPNDEPVSELLDRRRIAVSRAGPFELPASWAWVNVGAVAVARLGKMLDKAKNKGTPRRYLRNVNVRWFDFDLSDLREMRFEDSELPEFTLRFGDVLICEGGEPGRAAVWDDRENDIYFQKAIHRIRFLNIVDSEFFVKALRASADDGRLAKYFTGTGIKHFTGKGLAAYLFPLPPLAEQHRIVAKVDELMAVFDRIVASLASGNDTRRHLLNALLHEALSLSEEKIWKDISTIAQRTAGRTTRIARSVDRANIGRDII